MYPLLAYSRNPSGYTYTIASRVSHALREVESLFGPRMPGYFYAGHEFASSGPQTWFPENCGHVVIQLSMECMQDYNRAIFQLSHEVVHLLSPQINGNATNLEEGMATWFSEEYTLRVTNQAVVTLMPCYSAARDAVGRLMSLDATSIRRIREIQPCIADISADLLRSFCPGLTEDQVQFLSRRFNRSA